MSIMRELAHFSFVSLTSVIDYPWLFQSGLALLSQVVLLFVIHFADFEGILFNDLLCFCCLFLWMVEGSKVPLFQNASFDGTTP